MRDIFERKEYIRKYTVEPKLYKYEKVSFSDIKKPSKIILIGCGTGRDTVALARIGHKVLGIDISKDMIKKAKELHKKEKNVKFRVSNATDLNIKEKFDYCIISANTINLLKNYKKALKESYKVLKKNGILFFTMHNPLNVKIRSIKGLNKFMGIYKFKELNKFKGFYLISPKELARTLKLIGFKIVSISTTKILEDENSIFSKYPFNLFNAILIYKCQK